MLNMMVATEIKKIQMGISHNKESIIHVSLLKAPSYKTKD